MKKIIFYLFLIAGFYSCSQATYEIDLSGEWAFMLDPDDKGLTEQWYNKPLAEKIKLPGSLQEQGFGDSVSVDTKWTAGVNDSAWFKTDEYAPYRQPGNVKITFWLQPDKHYVGVAWYQREITIPSSWKGKHVALELERTHWETTLYINGKEAGKNNALHTPHRYTIEDSGKLLLTLRVDNRVHIPVGINAHSVSDHTQSNWNGIIGNIALSARPALYIDDVRVFPDVKAKKARVEIDLAGKTAHKAKITLKAQSFNSATSSVIAPVSVETSNGRAVAELEMGDGMLTWSEHTPNLYHLDVELSSPDGKEVKTVDFGMREFKAEGTRFTVNGTPVFLRGTLECCIFPLTGYPAMDAEYWTKIYRRCKEFGLNHVRFHSWCPPEVAFEVADREGIYLQVECGGWTTVGNGDSSDEWFYAESERIVKEYGNHPSFCLFLYGNEPGGPNQADYLSRFVDHWKAKDLRRVYTSAAGWPYIPNADYWNAPDPRIQAWGGGLKSIINAQSPRSDYDFREIIKKDMPTVSHEIGQWCVYPNMNEIKKYTGVLKARNFEVFKETLKKNHMGDLADDFLYASGKLQTLCYKADIEAALRTPGFAGFQLLDLHDFPGQGTALVGVLDPFWDTKGYVEGKDYSMFCNQTVPLIRFPKLMWLNNELMNVPVEFAHFGKEPVKNANIVWTVITSDNRFIGKGSFNKDLPLDNCIPAGNIEVSFEQLKKATQLTVTVQVENTDIKNQWNIWVYPAQKQAVKNTPYITSKFDESIVNRLNNGESVLLLSAKGSILQEKGGDVAVGFSSIFWNTAWTRNQPPHTLGVLCNPVHPALASFPNEGYSDYQWWDIVSDCDAINMNDFPAGFKPIIYLIDDWFKNRRLGILFEAKVGKGKLMVCSSGLDKDPAKYPAAAQFKQSLLEYMSSDKFDPSQELQTELITGLFRVQ